MHLTCSFCNAESTVVVQPGDTVECPRCGHPMAVSETADYSTEFNRAADEHSPPLPTSIEATAEHSPDGPGTETDAIYLGKYRVIREVASGGFGTVYKGFNETLEQFVAIKVPHDKRLKSKKIAAQFLQEARTTAQLDHPNIVSILDADRDSKGRIFIAMKWIEGQTLDAYVDAENPGLDERIDIMCQVAEAVHYANKNGYIHRDLKPKNIMVATDGRVYVTDFGLAIHEANQFQHRGEIAGTVPYMSPEQLRGESHFVDCRTDVWALGVMLYELLSGKRPFSRKSDLVEEILERTPKPVQLANEDVPAAYNEVCLRALKKQVDERIPTAKEFRDELIRAREVGTSRLLKIALAFLPILLGVILIVVAVSNRDPETTQANERTLVVEPLSFPKRDSSKWSVVDGELDVTTDAPSLFTFQEIDHDEFQFSIDFYQTPWLGGFGLVFGLDGERFQMIRVVRVDVGEYAVNREVVETVRSPADGPTTTVCDQRTHNIARQEAGEKSRFKRLTITVKNGKLAQVTLDGEVLPEMCESRKPSLSKLPTRGHIGVFVDRVSVRFKEPILDGKVHLLTAPPSNP